MKKNNMSKKKTKSNFWQNILKKEIPFCCNWTKPAIALYKMFFALILVFVILFSVVYGYLAYYAKNLKSEGDYLALINRISQNFYYSDDAFVGVVRELADDYLFIQPNSIDALVQMNYAKDLKVEKLVYSPAWVEEGQEIFPTDTYKVEISLTDVKEGDMIYINDLNEDDSGYNIKSILIIGYDELKIPEL